MSDVFDPQWRMAVAVIGVPCTEHDVAEGDPDAGIRFVGMSGDSAQAETQAEGGGG